MAEQNFNEEVMQLRLGAAMRFIVGKGLNERFGPQEGTVGIVLQGGMCHGAIRGLQRLGLANLDGGTQVPIYVPNVTYPVVDLEFVACCKGKEAALVDETGKALDGAVETIRSIA